MNKSRAISHIILSVVLGAFISCQSTTRAPSTRPGVVASSGTDSVALTLTLTLACIDSVGFTTSDSAHATCLPCELRNPTNAMARVEHARALWNLAGKYPYNESDRVALCIDRSYWNALRDKPGDEEIVLERAIFSTQSARLPYRISGIRTIDSIYSRRLSAGDSVAAARALNDFALALYDRAQKLDSRAPETPLDPRESLEWTSRDLTTPNLPAHPKSASAVGEIEALWASSLFARAAELTWKSKDVHSRYVRLSLAPLVLLESWSLLDSAARTILARDPQDSVATTAIALARFHRVLNAPSEYPEAMAWFDLALKRMPRADSIRYDALDMIFSDADDKWRYSFSAEERKELDRRAWSILDPLWLTPVNEVRIERRARVAEADFRYADIAAAGKAGSETIPGIMLLKRGAPARHWKTFKNSVATSRTWFLARNWAGLNSRVDVQWDYDHRIFHFGRMSLAAAALRGLPPTSRCAALEGIKSLYSCARAEAADLRTVPIYPRLDTIDVTLARFRAGDSVDMYVGSRLPLRRFPDISDRRLGKRDNILVGLFIADEFGTAAFESSNSVARSRESQRERFDQWQARVQAGRMMHRVEALEPRTVSAARGSRNQTSTSDAFFPLAGFGISDIIVADSISAPLTARGWRDLNIVPNGGVFAPGEAIAMAWEIYDLKPGANGRIKWRVTVKREDGKSLANKDLRGLIVGSPDAHDKVLASEPDATSITYTRDGPAESKTLEYLRFTPTDAGPGMHVILVSIQDLNANRAVTKAVSVRVLPKNAQLRVPQLTSEMPGYQAPMPPVLPIIKPPPFE